MSCFNLSQCFTASTESLQIMLDVIGTWDGLKTEKLYLMRPEEKQWPSAAENLCQISHFSVNLSKLISERKPWPG